MERWEYLVTFLPTENTSNTDDQSQYQDKECLDEFGFYGWELVQVLVDARGRRIYMKRRRTQ